MRWGILGTGWIAERFVAALRENTRQQVVAVGSRSHATARNFADRMGIRRAHATYEDLTTDNEVDIVYVATPHQLHVEHGLLAIAGGKHVLIEKPIALDTAGLDALLSAATAQGVLCQEAFWSFFLPKFDVIRQLLDDGILGEIHTILADHGELLPPPHRIHDSDLAGGSLHDLGVYNFALATWAGGEPDHVVAVGLMARSGVIGDVAVAMRSGGTVSSLSCTMMTTTPCSATIAGDAATLTMPSGWFFPGDLTLVHHASGRALSYREPNPRHGALYFEAAEVARRIHEGARMSPVWTPDNSRIATRVLQRVKEQLAVDA